MGILAKKLRSQNYDLIDGPIRNHGLGQIWRKLEFQPVEKWKSQLSEMFDSTVTPSIITSPSLSISSKDTSTFKFKIGVSALEGILEALSLGALDLAGSIKGGKTLTISYDEAETLEILTGELFDFFDNADFKSANGKLYQQLNNDRFMVLSGIVQAKNLKINIKTNIDISTELEAELNQIVSGKAEFSLKNEREIQMSADVETPLPVAVKAHRIYYHKGAFVDLKLVTDNRFFF